eukprot:gene13832-19750_t
MLRECSHSADETKAAELPLFLSNERRIRKSDSSLFCCSEGPSRAQGTDIGNMISVLFAIFVVLAVSVAAGPRRNLGTEYKELMKVTLENALDKSSSKDLIRPGGTEDPQFGDLIQRLLHDVHAPSMAYPPMYPPPPPPPPLPAASDEPPPVLYRRRPPPFVGPPGSRAPPLLRRNRRLTH